MLVASWLQTQPEGMRDSLKEWLGELWEKGLGWVIEQAEPQVATTRVGLVQNGLSQLNGCVARPQVRYFISAGHPG